MDLAGKYSFIVQKDPKEAYCGNIGAALQLFGIYFKEKNHLHKESYVSANLTHDNHVTPARVSRKEVVKNLGQMRPSVRKQRYALRMKSGPNIRTTKASPTCVATKFFILTHHETLSLHRAEKVSGGISGKVKRLAAKASLQALFHPQIMHLDLVNRAEPQEDTFLLDATMCRTREKTIGKFKNPEKVDSYIPGSRHFHRFEPVHPKILKRLDMA